MTYLRFSPSRANAVAREESASFWTSPWSMVTEWRDPKSGRELRVYPDAEKVYIEIEMSADEIQAVTVDLEPTRVTLILPSKAPVAIPLPLVVDPRSATAVVGTTGLQIEAPRWAAEGSE